MVKIITGSRMGTKAICAVVDDETLDSLPLLATDNGDGTATLKVDTELTATIDPTGLNTNQIVMTGSAIQFSATSKVYKRIILSLGADTANPIYVGNTGVTTSTGFNVPDIGSVELLNVDISTLYAIGTSGATEILTWIGEY